MERQEAGAGMWNFRSVANSVPARVVTDAMADRPPLQGSTVGQRIRAAYERAGLKRAHLARLIEVDYKTVINWEKGASSPRSDSLQRVAEATGFGVEELMGESRVVPEGRRQVVEDWLVEMGQAVRPEHAEELRRTHFYGEVTAELLHGLWSGMVARDRTRGLGGGPRQGERLAGKRPPGRAKLRRDNGRDD